MDIEKPSYADKPLVFAWHMDWRPRQLEEAEAAIGLPSAKTRDRQLVAMGGNQRTAGPKTKGRDPVFRINSCDAAKD